MKIAQLIIDDREPHRKYELETPYFGTAPTALFQGFAGMPEIEVHVVSCTQRPMKSVPKLAENIYFHSLYVPHIGWLRTAYQGCIRAARRKLQEIQPDIVHGQGTERDSCISAVFSGFPNVLTLHGNMRLVAKVNHARPFSFLWLAAQLEAFTIPRSNGVVCITNYTREAVASLARKTWVLPNAVDASFFDIAHVPSPMPRILCVGAVDVRKNQNALIRAMDKLQPEGKFEVLFLGGARRENPYGREFFDLIEARPWCHYGGFANREELKQHMSSASGLVLASLEDNCPMVVLEAMAAGVPIAAARVGGVPDLIRHGENGLLFDPLNQESMAEVTRELLDNRDSGMAKRAKDEALKRFHPQIIATRHLEIYREVLSAAGR
jgi:glycosyltransferase involved in cell wall biosynthesis